MPPESRHPVRVLFVANDVGLGGAQRVLLHQASTLDRTRFAIEVASFEFDPNGALVPAFADAGIQVHRLRRAGESPLAGLPRLFTLLRRYRPDLVHTHLAAAGVLARVAARSTGVARVVTTLHNLSDWEEKRASPLRWLDRRTLPLADAVVTVSDAVRAAFVAACPRLAERALTVYNGVPLEELFGVRRQRTAMRGTLNYHPEHFVIGSIARLEPRKGLETLIEALALAAMRAPAIRVLIVGDGPERERLEVLARHRGVGDRIRFVGHQTRVHDYLAAMDLFAAPSRTEGLGMAIIESLAAGVPVLGSRVGGIPEVVIDGQCGRLLPCGAAGAWAETMVECATRPEGVAAWARAAPTRARRFSLEASEVELMRLYDRLMGTAEPEAMAQAA